MTVLDKALEAARGNKGKAAEFYNLFLSAQIFIPTAAADADDDMPVGYRRLEKEETIRFLVLNDDDGAVIPVFESADRLAEWAGQEMRYVALAGHVLVNSLHPDARIVLNPGAENGKLFEPEELCWLRDYACRGVSVRGDLVSGETVRFRKLEQVDPNVLLAIDYCLTENPEVAAAYLGDIESGEAAPRRLVIVLDVGSEPEHVLDAVARDLGVALSAPLDDEVEIDVMRLQGDSTADKALPLDAASPVYLRPTHPAPSLLQ